MGAIGSSFVRRGRSPWEDIKYSLSLRRSLKTSNSCETCLSNMSISLCSLNRSLSWSRIFESWSIVVEIDLSLSSKTRISVAISPRRGLLFIVSRIFANSSAWRCASSTCSLRTRGRPDDIWLLIWVSSLIAWFLAEMLRVRSRYEDGTFKPWEIWSNIIFE